MIKDTIKAFVLKYLNNLLEDLNNKAINKQIEQSVYEGSFTKKITKDRKQNYLISESIDEFARKEIFNDLPFHIDSRNIDDIKDFIVFLIAIIKVK